MTDQTHLPATSQGDQNAVRRSVCVCLVGGIPQASTSRVLGPVRRPLRTSSHISCPFPSSRMTKTRTAPQKAILSVDDEKQMAADQ